MARVFYIGAFWDSTDGLWDSADAFLALACTK